jgi:hypothetical protein
VGGVGFEGERVTVLAWLPLQRFLYRQLMYYVLFKSLFAAMRGQLQGWGKLERTGRVEPGLRGFMRIPRMDPSASSGQAFRIAATTKAP